MIMCASGLLKRVRQPTDDGNERHSLDPRFDDRRLDRGTLRPGSA